MLFDAKGPDQMISFYSTVYQSPIAKLYVLKKKKKTNDQMKKKTIKVSNIPKILLMQRVGTVQRVLPLELSGLLVVVAGGGR